jgi:hypothetical protein
MRMVRGSVGFFAEIHAQPLIIRRGETLPELPGLPELPKAETEKILT